MVFFLVAPLSKILYSVVSASYWLCMLESKRYLFVCVKRSISNPLLFIFYFILRRQKKKIDVAVESLK
jgi:hypothetical protein